MMTLNYNEKDFQKKLQKDIEMPEIVHEHINQAYRLIENNAVLQKKASKDPYHWMKSGGRIAGGMAAVLAVGFVFCAINPVMAKNIPVVGGLFEILQDNVSFFGDFSDHATTLEAVDGTKTDSSETDGAKTDHANNDAIYTKTADGLTITCSEVYANSQAIYVTMQFKSDKPFPETETGAESGTPVIDLDMTGGVDFNSEASPVIDGQVEGKFLDDNTYACIFRYDLAEAAKDYTEYNEKYNEMTQQVMDEMGITQADLDDQTDEGYALLEEFINKVSERGGAYQRPGGRHVSGQSGGVRRYGGHLPQSAAPLHQGPVLCHPGAGSHGEDGSYRAGGLHSFPGQSAGWLQVPYPLRQLHGLLQGGSTRPARDRAGPLRVLPPVR